MCAAAEGPSKPLPASGGKHKDAGNPAIRRTGARTRHGPADTARKWLNCADTPARPAESPLMHTASLSSKGQIVIPKALRNELNLLPGTRFELSVDAGRLVLEPLREPEFDLEAIHAAVDQLAGCLYRPEAVATSAPEDEAAIVALLGREDHHLGRGQP